MRQALKSVIRSFAVVAMCSVVSAVMGGGPGAAPCQPEEMRWNARQWCEYMKKGQETVRNAYREVERIEAERAEARRNQVKILPRQKDRFGDPMYVTYGQRAYAGTPEYVGPRYASSFEPLSPRFPYQTDVLRPISSIYVPSAPAKSDVVLKPSASRPY